MNFHLDAARSVITLDRSRAWASWLILLLRTLLVRLARLAPALLVPTSSPPTPPTVTPTMPSRDTAPVLVPSSSSSSLHSLYSLHADRPATPLSVASSRASVDLSDRPRVERTITGLHDCGVRLSAKRYKTPEFAADVLRIINEVSVPSWVGLSPTPRPEDLNIYKVAGSLTNAIFFVSSRAPEHTRAKTFLLRVYGPSSGNLISRTDELRMLHILSSRYRIGPRLYGTFSNGRLEEYFDSDALTPEEMRDPTISAWTARRMAEMHRVDVESVVGPEWRIASEENVDKWLQPAKEVLQLVDASRKGQLGLDLEKFFAAWRQYLTNVLKWEETHGRSPRVFAHNDAQYGNLLKLRKAPMNKPPHHQIIVVDFEYAAPNPAAVDIANHFQEWTTAYNSSTPHLLRPDAYPSLAQRRNFYTAYLGGESADWEKLERQVCAWSAASHGMWAVWSLVQAREQVEAAAGSEEAEVDFDYLAYSASRLEEFYRLSSELEKNMNV